MCRWATTYASGAIEGDLLERHAMLTRALPEPLAGCLTVGDMRRKLREWTKAHDSEYSFEETLKDCDFEVIDGVGYHVLDESYANSILFYHAGHSKILPRASSCFSWGQGIEIQTRNNCKYSVNTFTSGVIYVLKRSQKTYHQCRGV